MLRKHEEHEHKSPCEVCEYMDVGQIFTEFPILRKFCLEIKKFRHSPDKHKYTPRNLKYTPEKSTHSPGN